MKAKHLCSLLLFLLASLSLTGQDAAATDQPVKVTPIKEGTGESPVIGKEYEAHFVITNAQDGAEVFSTRKMGVALHELLKEPDTDNDKAFLDAITRTREGGVYRMDVPKTLIDENDPARKMPGDYVVVEMELLDVSDAAPSGAKLIESTLEKEGIDAARSAFDALHKDNSEGYRFHQWDMNVLGYKLLGEEKKEDAVAVFTMNTVLFPDSANAQDSLGDAYAASGNVESARICYERALQINPDFLVSKEKLEKLDEGK